MTNFHPSNRGEHKLFTLDSWRGRLGRLSIYQHKDHDPEDDCLGDQRREGLFCSGKQQ